MKDMTTALRQLRFSAEMAARRYRQRERDALSPTTNIAGALIAIAALAVGVSSGSWLLSGFGCAIAAGVVVSIRNRKAARKAHGYE